MDEYDIYKGEPAVVTADLLAWHDRRSWSLERQMAARGIISSREVPRWEWDLMVERAESDAGPRPGRRGTGTTGRPRRPSTSSATPSSVERSATLAVLPRDREALSSYLRHVNRDEGR